MTKDEALRMALEALHGFIPYLPLQDEAQCGRYDQAITAIKEALAQPEQGPVAWMYPDALCDKACLYLCTKGFTQFPECATTPQRKPLTDEEIAHATAPVFMGGNPSLTGIARAIEAAHGIK